MGQINVSLRRLSKCSTCNLLRLFDRADDQCRCKRRIFLSNLGLLNWNIFFQGYVCGFCARNESVNCKIRFDPNFVKSDPSTFKTVAFSRRVVAILLSWPEKTICLKDVLNLLPVNSEDVAVIGRLFDRFMAYGFIVKSPFLKVTHRRIVHNRIYERLCQFFCNVRISSSENIFSC